MKHNKYFQKLDHKVSRGEFHSKNVYILSVITMLVLALIVSLFNIYLALPFALLSIPHIRVIINYDKYLDYVANTDNKRFVSTNVRDNLSNQHQNVSESTFYESKVVGTSFKQNEISELYSYLTEGYEKYDGWTNSDILNYGNAYTWEYPLMYSYHVSLEYEPENVHDSNAIKVIVTENETMYHVGYIKKTQLKKINELLSNNTDIRAEIKGGRYKYVDTSGLNDTVKVSSTGFGVKLMFCTTK